MNSPLSRTTPHPVSSLLLLLVMMIVGALIGALVGLLVAATMSDAEGLAGVLAAMENPAKDLIFFRYVQAFSSIGLFVLPPLALGMVEGNWRTYAPSQGRLSLILVILVILTAVASGPLIDYLGALNRQMTLPASLAELEKWMYAQEKQMEELTLLLLGDTSWGGLWANIVVVAMIPAIGEELLFRGALQSILHRWLKNPHVAIWITAIVFSAIHLQFYGFLPRVALGAFFGYLFYWSGNIWLPILAHFVNNAGVLITAFVLQKQGKELHDLNYMEGLSNYTYFISFAVTIALLWYLSQNMHRLIRSKDGEKLD